MLSEQNTISLKAYHRALINADWFYQYSDDFSVRQHARDHINELKQVGESHPVANKVWRDSQEWVGKLWNNPKAVPPNCPKINMDFKLA